MTVEIVDKRTGATIPLSFSPDGKLILPGRIYPHQGTRSQTGMCALCDATGTEDNPIELTRTVVGNETWELCTRCYRMKEAADGF